ncbi:hypothetical protein PINS_up006204 [Pythium insidiosum]|nr:hypothetical protein PINS_up006204 [Pythium insidiosum]
MATDPNARDAFLAAFEAWTSPDSTHPVTDDKQRRLLLLGAVVTCDNPQETCAFLQCLSELLERQPRFQPGDAADVTWRWLMKESELLAEIDTRRFDVAARHGIAQLRTRVESGNDPEVHIAIRSAPTPTSGEAAALAQQRRWGNLSMVVRHSSNRTLRRLASTTTHQPPGTPGRPSGIQDDDKHAPFLSQRSSARLTTVSARPSESVPSLLRSFSTMFGMPVEETFRCQICFENQPVAESVELEACGHRFCADCFKQYLELKISEGQVYPVCFHETVVDSGDAGDPNAPDSGASKVKACGVAVSASDISNIVDPDVWKKYLTFKFNKEHDNGRQCPYCSFSQICVGAEQPECTCESCGKIFCFFHGNAHQDATCADYELKNAESDKLNRTAIAEIAKPCPGCQNNVEKNGGCNHMKCIVCNTSFCWICGELVEDVPTPSHFAWWNLNGCGGKQMVDVDNQSAAERFWGAVFRVLFLIVCVPPGFVLAVAITLCSCFCIPCMRLLDEKFSTLFFGLVHQMAMLVYFLLVAVVLLAVFILAWGADLVTGILCCCCRSQTPPDATEPVGDGHDENAGGDAEPAISHAPDAMISPESKEEPNTTPVCAV